MLNTQKPTPKWYHEKGLLLLHSVFLTIQGEGPFAGRRSVFVRLGGCNLQCPGCDTEYTDGATHVMPAYIADRVARECKNTRLVVLTGGEPLRQNIVPLVEELISRGYHVQLETNGVFWLPPLAAYPRTQLTIVCSPKTVHIHAKLAERADAFKYVLTHDNVLERDGLPITALWNKASPHVARPPNDVVPVYVQPADEQDAFRNALNMRQAISACLQFGYIFSLQIHKYAEVP